MKQILATICILLSSLNIQAQIPELKPVGDTQMLYVDGEPFIMMAGELHNSTSSSASYQRQQQVWPRLKALNLNTVIATVTWEQVEPVEGKFDFSLVDTLINNAQSHDMKLVLIWFGTFKNPFMTYAPSWVKTQPKRFPRALDEDGNSLESLSVFDDHILKADTKAYCKFLAYLKEKDTRHTVVMIQVENEPGLRGSKRDFSDAANKVWQKNASQWIADYKRSHPHADIVNLDEQVFTAHGYANFLQKLADAGKKVYPLPTFINASVFGKNTHGVSLGNGCSIPEFFDIYRKTCSSIDVLTPNAYMQELDYLCAQYHRKGNALLIPESTTKGARALYAFGEHHALAFSPFAIDAYAEERTPAWLHDADLLSQTYTAISDLGNMLTQHFGKKTLRGAYIYTGHECDTLAMDGYRLYFSPQKNFDIGLLMSPATGDTAKKMPKIEEGGAIVIQTTKDEFYIIGYGFDVTIRSDKKANVSGYDYIQEGCFRNGQFIGGRILNGDERNIYAPQNEVKVFKVKMYNV